MNVFELSAVLRLDKSEYESGLNEAKEKTFSLGEKLKSGLGVAAKAGVAAIGAATAATAAFAKSSVDVGMNFDKSMSQVAATMGVSTDEIKNLRDFAMEMGAKTSFSATQAADALNYMALAGYTADESMAALPNVLNLAAAGGIELARASDMVTDAQSALGLSFEESALLVDKMAKASSKSNTSVAQLGDAILTVGGTAKTLAGGTTELSTALGILADNGVKGAEGGTALRNIILSLSAPTDKAAKTMASLGINAYDANGNLRPLNETFQDLDAALSAMTQGEQTNVLNTLFNKVDLKSANALLANSGERFNELSKEIDGAWLNVDSLASSLSDVGMNLGSMSVHLGTLGVSGQEFSDILMTSGGNAELFAASLLSAADAGVTQGDIMTALGGSLENLQTAFDNTTGAAQAMADTQLDNLAGDITLFQSALEGAQIVLSDQLTPNLREFVQFGTEGITKVSDAFKEGGLSGAMEAFGTVLSDGINMIIEELPSFVDAGMKLLDALGQGIIDNMPAITDAIVEVIPTLVEGITTALPGLADGALKIMIALGEGLVAALPELVSKVPEIIAGLVSAIVENLPQIVAVGLEIIAGLALGLIQAIPNLIAAIPQVVNALIEGFCNLLGIHSPSTVFSGFGKNVVEGLINGIKGMISGIKSTMSEVGNAVKNSVKNLPSSMLNIGKNIISGLKSGISAGWSSFKSWFSSKIGGLASAAKSKLGIHSPSTVFAGIGGNMALGLEKGWDDKYSSIKKDIESGMIFNSKRINVDYASSGMGQMSKTISNSIQRENDSGQPINLVTQVVLDGRVIGSSSQKYTVRQQKAYRT